MSVGRTREDALSELKATVESFTFDGLSDSRRQVLEAFLRLATTEGYAAATMRGLGRQLNIKAPSLYSHFPGGKDELIAMALRWHYARWAAEVIQAVRGTDDPRAFLRALIEHHVRSQLQMLENDMFDLLLATDRISGTLPDATRNEAAHLIALYRNLYAATFADMDAGAGLLRAPEIVVSLLDSVRSWSGWDGTEDGLAEVVLAAEAVVFRIIDPRTASLRSVSASSAGV